MVGITEWADHTSLCMQTMEGFRLVQKKSPIQYAADSLCHTLVEA